jgi:hypothetical protein
MGPLQSYLEWMKRGRNHVPGPTGRTFLYTKPFDFCSLAPSASNWDSSGVLSSCSEFGVQGFLAQYVNHTCALLPQFVSNCGPVFCFQTLFITRTVLHATIISITCDQN